MELYSDVWCCKSTITDLLAEFLGALESPWSLVYNAPKNSPNRPVIVVLQHQTPGLLPNGVPQNPVRGKLSFRTPCKLRYLSEQVRCHDIGLCIFKRTDQQYIMFPPVPPPGGTGDVPIPSHGAPGRILAHGAPGRILASSARLLGVLGITRDATECVLGAARSGTTSTGRCRGHASPGSVGRRWERQQCPLGRHSGREHYILLIWQKTVL